MNVGSALVAGPPPEQTTVRRRAATLQAKRHKKTPPKRAALPVLPGTFAPAQKPEPSALVPQKDTSRPSCAASAPLV
jgi:hypothetical protein